MYLIDTHAHIYLPEFDADRDAVIERATAAGIATIVMPAIDAATHDAMLAVEALYPNCIAMIGLHPCSVKDDYEHELQVVKHWLEARKFAAIGEIGLDFYWDTTYTSQQYEAFERQIAWAAAENLPIVIHSRNAIDECIDVVAKYKGVKGIFHCFTGTSEQAQKIIDLGLLLGIGGVVTYKNAGLDKVIQSIGIQALVLETDAPYLAPVPYRGKRNECSYITAVAAKIAAATGISTEEIVATTTKNAMNLFKLS